MSPAQQVSSLLTRARAILSKTSKPETECPICAAENCFQGGQQEATAIPKQICGECMEKLHCKLHDKKEYEWQMSQYGMAHQWYRYKDVETPKCRKVYLGEDRTV